MNEMLIGLVVTFVAVLYILARRYAFNVLWEVEERIESIKPMPDDVSHGESWK
jgi:hypothetical protein